MDNLQALNMIHQLMHDEDKKIAEAHSLACQALNDKIPMYCRVDSANGLHCPCCDHFMYRTSVTHFCPKCGQAIKWRKHEEVC